MTNGSILQLNTDEVVSAWFAIDPVHVLSEELAGRSSGDREPAGHLHPWPASPGHVLLEDLHAGRRCLLPLETLTAFHTAALAAVAARALVAPGVVTAAVLGAGPARSLLLGLLTRHLSGLSHVAVCPAGPRGSFELNVLDELGLAGVGWSATDTPTDAALGATLVAAMTATPGRLEQPATGALLISTTGSAFAGDVLDTVSQLYVDDLTLAGAVRDNGRRRRVEADLGRVLSGAHPGRTNVDDILLVELLGAEHPDVRLACELHRAALVRGLGIPIDM